MQLTNTIKKTTFLVLGLIGFQVAGYCSTFEAVASGDWSSSTTWGGTAPSTTNTGDDIVIPSGITVTLDNNVTINGSLATLNVGGKLTGASTYTLDIASGTLSGAGTVTSGEIDFGAGAIVSFTGSITADNVKSSTLSLETSANIVVNENLSMTSGVLTILTGGSITLGNNSTLTMAGGSLAASGGSMLFSSNYSVEYTSASVVTGVELTGTGLESVTINVPSNSSVTLGTDLNVKGTLTLTSGTLNLGSHSLEISGDLAASGSGAISSTAASSIIFSTNSNISGTLMFTGAGSSTVNNLTVNVGSGNHVNIGGPATVAGTLTLSSGSLAMTSGSDLTLSGDIANTGTGDITASTGGNLTVNSANAPSGSLNFDAASNTLNNFTINMSNGGSVKLGTDLQINGTLTLTKGDLYIGSHILTIGGSGSVSGASSSSYVVTGTGGRLAMSLTAGATSPTMYPVGTTTAYFPAAASLNSGSSSGMISVNVAPGVYGHGTTGTLISATQGVVNATWDFQSNIASNMNMNMMLMWNASAEVNAFDRSKAYISHYTNNAWDVSAAANATVEGNNMYAVSRNNITSFSPFAVFEQNTNAGIEPSAIAAGDFNIYPNPTADNLYIPNTSLNGKIVYVDITDISGKTIGSYKLDGSSTAISLSGMKPGCYFVKLYNDRTTVIEKFIKD